MFTFDSVIRYSETGSDGRLSVPALVNYFQDCSTFQSESLGAGIGALKARSRAWFLSYWQIEVKEYPKMLTPVTVGTAPWEFRGFFGNRNFAMFPQGGVDGLTAAEKADLAFVNATSLWTLVDISSGRPARLTPEDTAPFSLEERLPMEYLDRKIHVPEGGEERAPIPVTPDFIDTNGHVNNARYIAAAMEQMPAGYRPRRIRVSYVSAAALGDVLCPLVSAEDGRTVISLRSPEGTAFAVVEFA